MASESNADLIGHVITILEVPYTVVGSETWSNQYVKLEADGEPTICRPAGVVRRHLQLTKEIGS